ncbi:nuclear transport factor 2 family protein [Cryptosporangium minutisporangium]|uniref:SnoaL-like domain-containing protein n=1 Tax=Cryptosporangium minutisporangium TaxID=113569 RepID=A0ABP6SPI3_9ACTN
MPSPQEIYERYVGAGAIRRDADAVADLFTEDGVFEAPLVPPGHPFPARLKGRAEIRRGLGEYYRRPQPATGAVDAGRSRLVLHLPASELLIAEVDAVFVDGSSVSLVQIFRLQDGLIASLRDYFHPDVMG